jgi:hypothetical protein
VLDALGGGVQVLFEIGLDGSLIFLKAIGFGYYNVLKDSTWFLF